MMKTEWVGFKCKAGELGYYALVTEQENRKLRAGV